MQTIINNSERVFLIYRKGFSTRSYFVNLKDIPTVLNTELEPNDEYTISEFWNFNFKRCSKKHLNEMFIANQIDYKIK